MSRARLAALGEVWDTRGLEEAGLRGTVMLEPGSQLGPYFIEGFVASGGMGIVYRAHHRVLRKTVAIKVLGDTFAASPKAVERFEQEAMLQAHLQHPGLVGVTDFIASNGRVALVMEFVPGPSLEEVIEEDQPGPWPATQWMALMRQLLSAVVYAHDKGVIHRDLKPANVLLDRSGGRPGVPRITDFGIAKIVSGTGPARTGIGTRMGTVPYMAPEQFRGDPGAGPSSDLYALGMMAWRLAAGQLPVSPDDLLAASEIYSGRRLIPSFGELAGDIPAPLVRALDACLELAPARRPASAAALLEAFELPLPVLASLSTSPPPAYLSGGPPDAPTRVPTASAGGDRRDSGMHTPAASPARQEAVAVQTRRGRVLAFFLLIVCTGGFWVWYHRNSVVAEDSVTSSEVADATPFAPPVAQAGAVSRASSSSAPSAATVAPAPSVPPAPVDLQAPTVPPARTEPPALVELKVASAPSGFVLIPAGTFTMGASPGDSEASEDESPTRQVTISRAFWLQSREVTQGEYTAVTGTNPSGFPSCGGGANCPVEKVRWEDAVRYANALSSKDGLTACYDASGLFEGLSCSGCRLPTEAEWEYAARAGTTASRYRSPDFIAWTSENSARGTRPVGGLAPNAWGLYDMLGNVMEWTNDWYGDYSASAMRDPAGPSSGSYRVYRGGSWGNEARLARASYRGRLVPGSRHDRLGFRLARSVP